MYDLENILRRLCDVIDILPLRGPFEPIHIQFGFKSSVCAKKIAILFHFLRLRADAHAQYEIRVYADAICKIVADWVPAAYGAFEDYRLGGAVLSEKGLVALRRMLAGETVTQETSGMSKGEWREFEGALSE